MIKVNKELEEAWDKIKERHDNGQSTGELGTVSNLIDTLFHFMPDTKICIKDKHGKLVDYNGSFIIHSKDKIELITEREK